MALTASAFDSLELKDVGRRFGGRDALVGLNLTIRAGEFIALLGPSGSGKSTALNCLAGLLPLTDGQILIDGKRIDILPPEKRDFGMVFQNYALFPHMTVSDNVAFGLTMRRMPKVEIRKRVEETLALVKLEGYADKLPGQLSGGQQQRVAIARAVALQPRLVLMDEPLSNLDAKLRLDMRAEIRKLHQMLGLTTIYVTHDQEEALSMADRLVVLKDGRIQQVGTPEQIHDNPDNWYVADFMGYRNMLDGKVAEVKRDHVVIRVGDLLLRATATGALAVGAEVRVAIRPTDLLPAIDGALLDQNEIPAMTTLVEYQGNAFAIELSGPQDTTLHARISGQPPRAGDLVSLTAAASRVLAYPLALENASSEHDEELVSA